MEVEVPALLKSMGLQQFTVMKLKCHFISLVLLYLQTVRVFRQKSLMKLEGNSLLGWQDSKGFPGSQGFFHFRINEQEKLSLRMDELYMLPTIICIVQTN